jgi:hypothetical protein
MTYIPAYYIINEDGATNSSKRNPESLHFSKEFISSFYLEQPIILPKWDEKSIGLDRYVKELYFSIEKDFEENKDWSRTFGLYNLFKKSYTTHLRWCVYEYMVDFLIEKEKLDEALNEWETLQEEERDYNVEWSYRDSAIERLISFETLLKKPIIRGQHLYHMAPKDNQLTQFGKNNLSDVMQTIDTIIASAYKGEYVARFFANSQFKATLPCESYIPYFEHKPKFKEYIAWINSKAPNPYCKKDGHAKKELIYVAMRSEASRLLREGENEFRILIGAKKIGESWISETELFYKLKTAFSNLEVVHHGKPNWLGRQHFDIWFPNQNIAVEYQGVQHDEPIDFFGGDVAHKNNVKRDELKKQKCLVNGCFLIEVRPGYDITDIISKIEVHLTQPMR